MALHGHLHLSLILPQKGCFAQQKLGIVCTSVYDDSDLQGHQLLLWH